jgi:hypothetical protein
MNSNNINFTEPKTLLKRQMFHGYTSDGRSYSILATHNVESDEWKVDNIMWDEKGGTKDEVELIIKIFLESIDKIQIS